MILGIGTDMLDLNRISKIIKKYDQKFIRRIYGYNEIKDAQDKLNIPYNYFVKRFAAKEATWKALSPIRGQGLKFREIETLNDNNGKPYLFFSGKTKNFIQEKEINLNAKLKFDISLTDEPPFILAFVVISLAPCV